MIKRMNKVTSLLVAAAAVASIIPATGVSAADYKKIDSQEGTIYEAVAYKDGNFYVDGNTKDGDTDAAYLLNSGDYTELDNIDSGANITGTYGEKYLNVDSGDYYVDLSTGTVTDEDLAENNKDDAATALRKKVKADAEDRYTDYAALKTADDLEELTGAKFSQDWYKTTYTTSGGATVVYTDAKGNYIDANYNVGKIKAATATKSATLTNTEDTEQGMKVAVSAINVIGQDANNIYRTATITVTADEAITKINGINVTVANGAFTGAGTSTVSFEVIQKISKAQASDDIDGAKYAKTVNTYVVSDDAGVKETLLANAKFNIVDGKVIAYTDGTSVDVQTIELKSSNGYYYTDITDVDSEDATDVDVDANGNLWRLEGGYVYKFDNDEDWTKVYKVDGAMEKLSVYDQDNMVIWNEEDEVYSVIADEATTTPETPVETKTGWVQAANGTWTYNKADGTKATGWIQDGSWYYLKADGVMATGWVKDGSTWYYLNASGAMKTGWILDGSTWYFLNGSGAMQTGWLNDNGTWYYLNASGAMLANTTVDGYKLNASGAWVK
ncbi:cell wall-binding protein [Clostridium beijerinckii]|nr:cell wall-binding protein [Clostridium beijerinckii]